MRDPAETNRTYWRRGTAQGYSGMRRPPIDLDQAIYVVLHTLGGELKMRIQ